MMLYAMIANVTQGGIMNEAIYFYPTIFYPGIFGLAVSILVMGIRKYPWWKVVLFSLFWLYAMLILREALFPIPLVEMDTASAREQVGVIFSRINWKPFHYGVYTQNYAVFVEVAMNFLITAPVGIIFPIVFGMRKRGFFVALFFCAFGIEMLQLTLELLVKIPYRVIDISDVILNSGGFLFGYLLYYLSRRLIYLFQEKKP
jgi:glycopeptide antibiotics resistance protein